MQLFLNNTECKDLSWLRPNENNASRLKVDLGNRILKQWETLYSIQTYSIKNLELPWVQPQQ